MMRTLILLLLLFALLSWAQKPGVGKDGDVLQMIQIVGRHADRATESDPYITPAAEEAFFRGRGELSSDGHTHSREIGGAYREIYVTGTRFIDGRYVPGQVEFKASAVSRVLSTASGIAQGLFKDGGESVPAAVFTEDYNTDPELSIAFSCLNGWLDVVEQFGLTNTTDVPKQLLASLRKEWNCSQPPSYQSDTLLAEAANPITKGFLSEEETRCAEEKARTFMYRYIEMLGGSGDNWSSSIVRLRRTAGNLANAIIELFKDKLSHSSNLRAKWWMAHDVNLLAIMNIYSHQQGAKAYFNGLTPDYGCSLVIEMWSRETKNFIKMYVQNGRGKEFEPFEYQTFIPANTTFERTDGYLSLEELEWAKSAYIGTGDQKGSCRVDINTCCKAGVWSEWTPTGICQQPCGGCSSTPRRRRCLSMSEGCKCIGEAEDFGPCNLIICLPPRLPCCSPLVPTMAPDFSIKYCGNGFWLPPTAACNLTTPAP